MAVRSIRVRPGVRTGARPARSRLRPAAAGLLAVVTAAALAACTAQSANTPSGRGAGPSSGSGHGSSDTGVASPSNSPEPSLAAEISSLPAAGAKKVDPGQPFVIKVAHGTLTRVVMTNEAGKHVTGSMNTARTSWSTAEDLGYSKTYTVRSVARNADGKTTVSTEKITTLTPDNETTPTIERLGGYALTEGKKYGVAIVPVVHFDEPVYNFAAAEKAMSVQTSPHVAGAWYWADNQNAHWRPRNYWPSGTKVTVKADVYGVRLAKGLYGSNDASTSFVIGRKQVTIADDNAPKSVNKVRVYNAAGKVLRTMNTSMGTHGGTYADGQYINFYTLDGTYTVLDHENPANMCSASYGLPANAPGGYGCEPIYWSTKISTDGIYLHELLSTEYEQDHGYDVSHGCLNLDEANAIWFFKHSMDGDPVVVHGKKAAPTLQVWEGGDWTVPWSTWVKGGAAA